LLAGTQLAMSLTQNAARKADLRDSTRRLADEARPIRLTAAALRAARAQLNRLVIGYEQPLTLIETLVAGNGASWLNDEHVELSGFLFDMNRFFQELLEKFLREHLPAGHSVEGKAPLQELYRYSRNPKNKRRAPVLEPDFTVRGDDNAETARGCAHTWLLDAKYRDLWTKGLPPHMLYQLSVYALSQGRGATVAILYPTVASSASEAVLDICDPLGGSLLGRVALRPVNMRDLATAIATPDRITASALARKLAFGSGT
jgi:5-methylcytosine-specific restriction enzyme subunit McrC